MTVWIVLNGDAICSVFDSEEVAERYAKTAAEGLDRAGVKHDFYVIEEKVYSNAATKIVQVPGLRLPEVPHAE